MKLMITLCCFMIFLTASAQHSKEFGFSITNSNAAFSFSKFGGLFQNPLHPGAELSYGFNWKTKPKHDWYQQVKLGYFYHRFVQHGIPLYTNIGYRYKFSPYLFAEGALSAGYLHSIPATAKFKLGSDGEYKSNKGIGHAQAIVIFNIHVGYTFNLTLKKLVSVFASYQQRIQTLFVKSYVPLLPLRYNFVYL